MEARVEVACRLLAALIANDSERRVDRRESELRYALNLADALLAMAAAEAEPQADNGLLADDTFETSDGPRRRNSEGNALH